MKVHKLILVALALFSGCQENEGSNKPLPIELTLEAAGHYCQMTVLDHNGPKAQIHLSSFEHPFWFTQVRDAVAFSISPEEPKDIAAIYVNDMGAAESWDEPGIDNWIDADEAWFVIESNRLGGMGAPEAIPFGVVDSAEKFAGEFGGRVVRIQDIPDDYVLSPVELSNPTN